MTFRSGGDRSTFLGSLLTVLMLDRLAPLRNLPLACLAGTNTCTRHTCPALPPSPSARTPDAAFVSEEGVTGTHKQHGEGEGAPEVPSRNGWPVTEF